MDAVKRAPMLRADDRVGTVDGLRELQTVHKLEDFEHLKQRIETLENELEVAREMSWAALTALHDAIIDAQADAYHRAEALERARGEIASLRDAPAQNALAKPAPSGSAREGVTELRLAMPHSERAAPEDVAGTSLQAEPTKMRAALNDAEEGLRRAGHELQELRQSETAMRAHIVALTEQIAITSDVAQAVLATLKENCFKFESGTKSALRWQIGSGALRTAAARKAIRIADRARDAKEWTTAVRHYRNALRKSPNLWPIWIQYGHALKESGRLAEAELAYRRSIAAEPENADSYLQLGHALKLLGRIYEARRAYLYAAAIDPKLSDASEELQRLGWSLAHVTRLRELAGAVDRQQ